MNTDSRNTVCAITTLLIVCFVASCGEPVRTVEQPAELVPKIDLGTTIGSLVEVFSVESIPVEGYGLVGGLNGTGSSECPPRIRKYLKQYILQQLGEQKMDVEKFISSRNTAVVMVRGMMPAAISGNHYFDVMVAVLPGTQTTSLQDGWLYGAELRAEDSAWP